MTLFLEFLDRKQREGKKHLKLIERLLRKGKMQVYPHLENEEQPYVFVKDTEGKSSFEGVRIYEIGEMIAFRVQREEKTEPYGKAYLLDIEEMFNDYMSENMKEDEAAHKVVESVVLEIKKFFQKSQKAEAEMRNGNSGVGLIIKGAGGTDYGSSVLSRI